MTISFTILLCVCMITSISFPNGIDVRACSGINVNILIRFRSPQYLYKYDALLYSHVYHEALTYAWVKGK